MIVAKSKSGKVCYGLTWKEFKCKCKHSYCRCTIMSEDLEEAYFHFRADVDIPLYPTCGYRCPKHNKKVGGVALSRHQTGEAIDIAAVHLLEKYGDPEAVIEIAGRAGFNYIKYYKSKGIFHLDVRVIT